jgi:YD repeat-containing protein
VFSIAGNGVLDLGFAIQYRSRSTRRPADSTANNSTEDQHFVGWSWEDSYSDRLIVPSNAADPSVWSSLEETVAFSSGGHSTDGRFELTDHGAGQVPRWTIASRAANSPHRTWEFFDSTPSSAGDPPFRRGLLHAKTGAGFRVDIERVSTTDTRIVAVVDSLGRRLAFFYLTTAGEPTPPGGQTPWTWQLDHVTYTPAVGQQATLVASFAYDDSRRLVEVERAADYLRFNYLIPVPAPCAQCLALLTEVIQPRHAFGAIPARQTPPQPHEQVLEGHAFEIVDGAPRAVESWSPTTHWAYRYEPLQTVQIDLLLPKAVCTGAGTCPAGQACHATPQDPIGRCYVANVRPITDGRIGGVEHGGKPDEDEEYVYSLDAWHTPKATVARGVITSYTFDSQTGEPRCIVRNDDDYEAELDDPQQVEGDCYSGAAGPVQIVKPLTQPASNGGQTTSVTTTSVFQPAGTTTTRTTFDVSGLVSSVERLGWTQDLDATPGQQTRTTTRDYDNLGRLVRVDGPAENSEAMDVVEYTYHEGTNLDRGRLRYERRYVGTAGSHTIWETEYSEYDVAGVPHRIEAPDGLVTTLATGDGLNWEVIEDADDEQVVSYVSINPDGSRHHAIDADGVCITQEVDLAANRMITRRSPSNPPPGATSLCGVLPIDINFGEVLIVEHAPGDPSRVVKLEARRDGVVTKSVTGFQYDDGRRLVGAEGVGGIGDFETAYVDALEAGTTSPLWPAAGSWRTQVDADALARPTELRRYVGATSAQKTRLLYDTAWDGTPNRIERGLDSTVAQSAQFIYDDFGQIVETTSPDSGVTRWQYDAIGQRTHQRLGVGTADQRTDRTYYDVLGRIVRIDHDLEHPVDCATAGDGTPIADEEYDYDVCDPSAPQDFCLHTLGRLTSARRQIECGGGAPFSLVRRFKYDRRGRLMQSQSNDAGDIVYEWTPAGRLTSELPTGSFGTTTTYSPTGAIDALAQIEDGQPPVQIVGDVSHAPFAGLTGYQVFGALTLQRAHRLDGALERHAWLDTNDGWLDERLTYNPSGLVTAVEDAHAPARSRWYDYDHLLRLTCEREADPHDLASCDPENAQVRELFTYHDGASTLSPPDHRDTSGCRSDPDAPVGGISVRSAWLMAA